MKRIFLAATLLSFSSISFAGTLKYSVTDAICKSGSPVNFAETIPLETVIEVPNDIPGLARLQSVAISQVPQVGEIVSRDKEKQVIIATGINDDGKSYKTGRGPCPKDDILIIFGKRTK